MHSPENFSNQVSGPLHVLRREMSASSKHRHNDLRLCRSMLLDCFDFVANTGLRIAAVMVRATSRRSEYQYGQHPD